MSIYKRGGIWWYSLSFRSFRERKPIGPSKAQALEVFSKRRLEVRDELFFNIKNIEPISFKDFVPDYLEHVRKRKKSYSRYVTIMDHYLLFFSDKMLDRITPSDIERYRDLRLTQQAAPATINKEVFCLSGLCRYAIRMNRLKNNPVSGLKKLRVEEKSLSFLEKDEVKMLLAVAKGYLKAILTVAVYCGMRRNEILRLKWNDISFDQGFIQLSQTKNGKVRFIPLIEEVKTELLKQPRIPGSDYVFLNKNNKPFGKVDKAYRSALTKAGITRKVRFHDLRHTYATHAIYQGTDPMVLKELLGHSTLQMVMRYVHIQKEYIRTNAEKMSKAYV